MENLDPKTCTSGTGVSSVTVSGLDLATDVKYKVLVEITENGTSEDDTPYIRFNGDTTSNYSYLIDYGYLYPGSSPNTGVTSSTQTSRIYLDNGSPASTISHSFEIDLSLLTRGSGNNRIVGEFRGVGYSTGSADNMNYLHGSFCHYTLTNLTSLEVGGLAVTKNYNVMVYKAATS